MHGSFVSTCFHEKNTEKLDFFASFFGNVKKEEKMPLNKDDLSRFKQFLKLRK